MKQRDKVATIVVTIVERAITLFGAIEKSLIKYSERRGLLLYKPNNIKYFIIQ